MNRVTFDHVSYQYEEGDTPALQDVSFEVGEGEFLGIIGPNDAGKSTLCRACNGLIPHSFYGEMGGRVLIDGADTQTCKTSELSATVGFIFADPEAQMTQISVWEEVAFEMANLCFSPEKIRERVDWALELLHLAELKDRSPFSLSGGEQQRVAIASVLAMQPDILVLDEPTSNLDPAGTEEVFQVVADLNRKKKMTILMVEHEIEALAEYASRILLLDHGRVLLDGPAADVFHRVHDIEALEMDVPQVTKVANVLDEKYHRWTFGRYPMSVAEMEGLFSGSGNPASRQEI